MSGRTLIVSNQGGHDMITFRVEDMTCGGCVRAIRAAVAALAPEALVAADVASRRVEIEGVVDGTAIERAIAGAGFNVVRAPEGPEVALEAGDLEAGMQTASAIGDDTLQRRQGGQVQPDGFTHGTSAQRVEWLRRGYESGDPAACDTFRAL
jgi:copper chaperone CopZ